MTELTLGLVLTSAVLDSINPCVLGVLIFLLAFMIRVYKNKYRMLLGGFIYTLSVYISYMLIGLSILKIFSEIRENLSGVSQVIYISLAYIALVAGFIEIKDYFWYGKGFSLQIIPGGARKIKNFIDYLGKNEKKHPYIGLFIIFLLGIVAVLVEAPCTGLPYLLVLQLIDNDPTHGIPLLILYNFIFVLPLLLIIGLIYFGRSSKDLEEWRKTHRGMMRLGVGLLLLFFGFYMLNSHYPTVNLFGYMITMEGLGFATMSIVTLAAILKAHGHKFRNVAIFTVFFSLYLLSLYTSTIELFGYSIGVKLILIILSIFLLVEIYIHNSNKKKKISSKKHKKK